MSKITYTDDIDSGLIDIFVDEALFTTWSYEDTAELAFIDFKKIFEAGQEAGQEISLEEEQRLQKLKNTLVDMEKNYIRFQTENEKLKERVEELEGRRFHK